MKVTIYGSSDDLVEVEGDLTDEFGGDDVLLMFGDGTHIRAQYGKDGRWRLKNEKAGTATCSTVFTATDSDSDEYSDRMTLEGDIVSVEAWLSRGEVADFLTDLSWRSFSEDALRKIHALVKSLSAEGRP